MTLLLKQKNKKSIITHFQADPANIKPSEFIFMSKLIGWI